MANQAKPRTAALLKLLRDPELAKELLEHSQAEKDAVMKALLDAYTDPRAFAAFKPKERWRSKRPDETARAFMSRTYMKLPYEKRPYTHQLASEEHGDKPLYEALMMIITNNRRLDRTGEAGTLEGARKLSDILPAMGAVRGAKARAAPQGAEASLHISAQRALAAKRARQRREAAKHAQTD